MDTSNTPAPEQAGARDLAYGQNGIFTFSRELYGALTIGRVALDDQQRAVVALRKPETGVTDYYAIGRIGTPGKPDMSFGKNGLLTGQFARQSSSFGGITAITHDQKILLSGYHIPGPGDARRPAVARHLTTGELDKDFGTGGVVLLDFAPPAGVSADASSAPAGGPPDTWPEFYSFAITPLADGKTLFCGVTEPERDVHETRFSVVGRLNADGTLDSSFASQGFIYLPGQQNIVDQHLLLADGTILIAGQIESEPADSGYVTRLLSDGSLDTSFGNGGTVRFGLDGGYVTALALHSDNRLLIGANKRIPAHAGWSAMLWSLNADGSADTDFNGGQPVEIRLGTSGFRLILKDLLIDGDGVILLGDMGNMALVRYRLDGSMDTGFGDAGGWWQYPASESYALARQQDGKFLATGMHTNSDKFIARFLGA